MHIHDGLTQSVTSAVLELQALRRRIETDPEHAASAVRAVEDALRDDLREIRQLLFELEAGQRPAEPPLASFAAEAAARWKLEAHVSVEGNLDRVHTDVQDVAHGILAEALANVAKHAESPAVTVRLRADGEALDIEVEDRGRGMLVADADRAPHFGLRLLRRRTEEIGGHLQIESTPGRGTRVAARLPIER
jgi:signal transduction histidine kinase